MAREMMDITARKLGIGLTLLLFASIPDIFAPAPSQAIDKAHVPHAKRVSTNEPRNQSGQTVYSNLVEGLEMVGALP